MAKYGGGYLIFDIRGKTARTVDDRSAVVLTEEEIATIETAIAEKLPILYVGPAINVEDTKFTEVETAAFTHAEFFSSTLIINIPMIGYSETGCNIEKINGVNYLITPTA